METTVHPDDLANTTNEIQLALNGEKPFNTDFKLLKPMAPLP